MLVLVLGIYCTFFTTSIILGAVLTSASVIMGVLRQIGAEILSRLPEKIDE